MESRPTDIVIVGGGAAGFFAAITCAEQRPDVGVTILERSRHVLAKVRVSGGGRCNVTTSITEPAELVRHYPRGGRELRGPFTRFGPADVADWFTRRGVRLKTEPDERVFPTTDRSATIVNCLLDAARSAGVAVRTQAGVRDIQRAGNGLAVSLDFGERLQCDRLLLATGGDRRSLALAAGLGHSIVPPVPSLFTFNIRDHRLADLAGIAVDDVRLRLASSKLEQRGSLLITHWGLSGPAVLKLSAWGARALHDADYRADLTVNWLGEASEQVVIDRLTAARSARAVDTGMPPGLPRLPARLWTRLIEAAGIAPSTRWAELSRRGMQQLAEQLTRGVFRIGGKSTFKEEFVTCGGVSLREVDFATMASRVCPALHLAGEVLDIDGETGGFNFQSAWTTGRLAGMAMAASDR